MSRHIGRPVPVEVGAKKEPRAFTYNSVTYRVHAVISWWHLTDRWWDKNGRSNRYYYRVVTRDQ